MTWHWWGCPGTWCSRSTSSPCVCQDWGKPWFWMNLLFINIFRQHFVGHYAYVVGWGRTQHGVAQTPSLLQVTPRHHHLQAIKTFVCLQEVRVQVISAEKCQSWFQQASRWVFYTRKKITQNFNLLQKGAHLPRELPLCGLWRRGEGQLSGEGRTRYRKQCDFLHPRVTVGAPWCCQ